MKRELNKAEIMKLLRESGARKIGKPYTQQDIATVLKLSPAHVSLVISGKTKSKRVTEFISLLIGMPIEIKQSKVRTQY